MNVISLGLKTPKLVTLGFGSGAPAPPAPPAATPVGGGRGSRHRYFVRINDVDHEVRNQADAEKLIQKVKDDYERRMAVEPPKRKGKARAVPAFVPPPELPTIVLPPIDDTGQRLARLQAEIMAMHQQIVERWAKALEDDDEDVIAALLNV